MVSKEGSRTYRSEAEKFVALVMAFKMRRVEIKQGMGNI
jgi:hypothetical protein